jgi:hypothetical protein
VVYTGSAPSSALRAAGPGSAATWAVRTLAAAPEPWPQPRVSQETQAALSEVFWLSQLIRQASPMLRPLEALLLSLLGLSRLSQGLLALKPGLFLGLM